MSEVKVAELVADFMAKQGIRQVFDMYMQGLIYP